MKKNDSDPSAAAPDELNEKLRSMLREIMGRHTSSSIAKKCGVSVSTITRIRNGENKRGISDGLLHKIWMNRDPECSTDLSALLSVNRAVSDSNMQRETAAMDQAERELDYLRKQIQRNMVNSGFFIRKTDESLEIIPGVEFCPDASFEVAFESGEKRRVFFFTNFLSKRRIERAEKLTAEDPEYVPFYCRHYSTVLDFQELRALHGQFENSELVIVFNNEKAFRYNADILKRLSNPGRVSLALMKYDLEKLELSGKFIGEICLDGREAGILGTLGLIG